MKDLLLPVVGRWTLNVACPDCTGLCEACQICHTHTHVDNQAARWAERGSCSTCFARSRILLWLRSSSVVAAELLAFPSDEDGKSESERESGRKCLTFIDAQSGKWNVIQICQKEVGWGGGEKRDAKAASKLKQDGDRRSYSRTRYCVVLAWRCSNPVRISSLIKRHVSQCLKDYYEWHFPSKMPTSRQCWMQARCLQIIARWSGIKVVSLVAWFVILENSKLLPSTYLGSSRRLRVMLHRFLVWEVHLNLLLKLLTSLWLGHLWIPSLELIWSQPAVLILLHACGASSTEGNLGH